MVRGKTIIIVLVTLVIGFAGGFALRPAIAPVPQTVEVATSAPAAPTVTAARGTQYFTAHLDEARQVMASCREGSARGDECANAEAAVVKADSQARFKRFMGD
jgi:hypothetical protein